MPEIENISGGKIIGIGPEIILPGERKAVPAQYANNPALAFYVEKGFARLFNVKDNVESVPDKDTKDNAKDNEESMQDKDAENMETEADKEKDNAAETLRKARLASLKGISDESLGRLAEELGIHPAECRDRADVLKKVKAALKA